MPANSIKMDTYGLELCESQNSCLVKLRVLAEVPGRGWKVLTGIVRQEWFLHRSMEKKSFSPLLLN